MAALQMPGPAQAGIVVHFCGRPLGTSQHAGLDPAIASMHPADRLANILWEENIRGSVAFGMARPSISFSEASFAHLAWLITHRGFPSWGIVLSRQGLYDRGGGPVWYARPEEYEKAAGTPAADWAVRFETTPGRRSDWMHEQEWRLHVETLPVREAGLFAVLVGNPEWAPARWETLPTGNFLDSNGTPTQGPTGQPELHSQWWVPAIWAGLLRLWLNPRSGLVEPLPPAA